MIRPRKNFIQNWTVCQPIFIVKFQPQKLLIGLTTPMVLSTQSVILPQGPPSQPATATRIIDTWELFINPVSPPPQIRWKRGRSRCKSQTCYYIIQTDRFCPTVPVLALRHHTYISFGNSKSNIVDTLHIQSFITQISHLWERCFFILGHSCKKQL